MGNGVRILAILGLAIISIMSCNFSFMEGNDSLEGKHGFLNENLDVDSLLGVNELDSNDLSIIFVVLKDEQKLMIFGKNSADTSFNHFVSYKICQSSGDLGPKRKYGDYQVPEGFYHIDRFNPNSKYHLSLGINYPNESDKIKSDATDLGGDIFIHGKCVTIGCLPMTDEKIERIYRIASMARDCGQKKIPVYIFPFEMTDENMEKFGSEATEELKDFWKNIKVGYDDFFINHQLLDYKVNENGDYVFE